MKSHQIWLLAMLAIALSTNGAFARDAGSAPSVEVTITYAARRFSPSRVDVPAGKAVTVRVVNASKERIEFESFKLNRERVVDPGASILVPLPALAPGSYDFFDDFHEDVPEGEIVANKQLLR